VPIGEICTLRILFAIPLKVYAGCVFSFRRDYQVVSLRLGLFAGVPYERTSPSDRRLPVRAPMNRKNNMMLNNEVIHSTAVSILDEIQPTVQQLLSYRASLLSDLAGDLLAKCHDVSACAGLRLLRDELRSIAADVRTLTPEIDVNELLANPPIRRLHARADARGPRSPLVCPNTSPSPPIASTVGGVFVFTRHCRTSSTPAIPADLPKVMIADTHRKRILGHFRKPIFTRVPFRT
jgi:hypothetical protein